MRYIIMFLLIGVLCANAIFNVSQPVVETTLAMNQFENPTTANDTLYRNYDSSMNLFFTTSALVLFSFYIVLSIIKGMKK